MRKFETTDYQNRKNNVPMPNIPIDIIQYNQNNNENLIFSFQNTDEMIAQQCVEQFCRDNELEYNEIITKQDGGDDLNIWISCEIKGVKDLQEENQIKNKLGYEIKYTTQEDLFDNIVKYDSLEVKYASDELLENREIALKSVKMDGMTLKYLKDFQSDKEICEEAVKNYSGAIHYVKDDTFTNTEKDDLGQILLKDIENMFETLSQNLDKEETQQKIKEFMDFQAQFHNYSLNNQILLFTQAEAQDKTIESVASFQKWKELGANVNKGEQGLKIIIPVVTEKYDTTFDSSKKILKYIKQEIKENKVNSYLCLPLDDKKAMIGGKEFDLNQNNNDIKKAIDKEIDKYNLSNFASISNESLKLKAIKKLYPKTKSVDKIVFEHKEGVESKNVKYKIGNVFDVNQTNAKEKGVYKNLQYRDTNIEIDEPLLIELKNDISKKYNITIDEQYIANGAKGYYSENENLICLSKDLDTTSKLQTLFHELGHSLMHKDLDYETIHKDKGKIEGEAEAFCYLMSKHIGLNPQSELYIKAWGNDGPALKETMKKVTQNVQATLKNIDLNDLIDDIKIKKENNIVIEDTQKNKLQPIEKIQNFGEKYNDKIIDLKDISDNSKSLYELVFELHQQNETLVKNLKQYENMSDELAKIKQALYINLEIEDKYKNKLDDTKYNIDELNQGISKMKEDIQAIQSAEEKNTITNFKEELQCVEKPIENKEVQEEEEKEEEEDTHYQR